MDPEVMPNVEDLCAELAQAKNFTKLDLSMGYRHIPVVEDLKQCTSFLMQDGYFNFGIYRMRQTRLVRHPTAMRHKIVMRKKTAMRQKKMMRQKTHR